MIRLFPLLVTLALGACAARATYIAGTKVPYSSNNKSALEAVENYRTAVERGDAEALMMMAHKEYWEDSGTPSGSDDYGFEGLRTVLTTRFKMATDIRYSMRYVGVTQQCSELAAGCQATVDVLIDASFTINNVHGAATRPDKRDQGQFLLEWDGQKWLFRSGM